MSITRDKQIKGFLIFLILYALLILGTSITFYDNQMSAIKSMYLEHDTAITSSLLEQGISEQVIATAFSNKEISWEGVELLNSIGINEKAMTHLLPFIFQFQQHFLISILFIGILFILLLFTGTLVFLFARNKLYLKAEKIVNSYIDCDYSCHLPQNNEGEIDRLFSSVEQLATMLQSQNETEHKTKEFLKTTISDISHQLKTPLAALTMYQEIIENEPENVETVKEFCAKTGIALIRMEQLIQSILKITRLDTGNIAFNKQSCLVKEVVIQATNELTTRAQNEDKQIIITGNPEQSLFCDMEWTSEAVGNLVKNALDHTKQGGIIHIRWENGPTMLRIIICLRIIGLPMHWVIFVSLITNFWGVSWNIPCIPLVLIISVVLFTSFLQYEDPQSVCIKCPL